ncbi:GTP cyclohydrolase II [Polytolypa hystricis UAMH7299]|uniref:GTP cyclohydrolase II n=1 Tax=Polytolypa hystricis (strain UAMH7299) TaxID=1447883 RepID=A0A2B7Y927_POLH7|nr:GTP cyclohydrolase II [Polytolypa hystricis UAMH7299]
MPDLPSHASVFLSPKPVHPRHPIAEYSSLTANNAPTSAPSSNIIDHSSSNRDGTESRSSSHNGNASDTAPPTPAVPGSTLSPAFTPPSTPGAYFATQTTSASSDSRIRAANTKPPKLLPHLPNVECIVRARIPTTSGAEMFLHLYQNDTDAKEHLAIVFGNEIRSRSLDRVREGETEMDRMIRGAYVGRLRPGRVSSRFDEQTGEKIVGSTDGGVDGAGEATRDEGVVQSSNESQAPLVRIHSECYTGETAWSARCDCGEQLDEAARLMSEPQSPGGVIVYLRQEGRGIGLGEKLKAYNLQDLGSDTVEANLLLRHPADARSYGLATAMLVDLGLGTDSGARGIQLLTNNPDKVLAVEGPNREVTVKDRVPMIPIAWRTDGQKGIRSMEIEDYLRTKIGKMGHMLQSS